jgi:preprotein translocase subunit SecB
MTEPNTTQPFFGLEKLYLKDASYEAPGAPDVFLQNQQPEVGVQISLAHRPIDAAQGFYESVLTVQVNAKREDKTLFLVEVHQAGIFRVVGLTGEVLERTLEVTCAYILLPYAREAVSDLIGKGGFPQLLINPINFDALYEQKRAAIKQPAQGQA